MVLTESQNKIAEDTHRFRVINSGRRFGKTVLATEEIKGKALSKPRKIVYIGPTLQQTRDLAWNILLQELRGVSTYINESRLELKIRTVNGEESIIYLRGWEAVETLRGQSFDFIVLDEIASMRNFELNWQEVLRPTLADRRGEAMFISTPKGFNHFYDLYNLQNTDSDYKSFHFTTFDNPHIPIDEIEKARKEVTEDRFAQEYLADFRKTQGLVYKEFDRNRHVFTDLPNNLQWVEVLAGIDWGWTNPASAHKILKDTQNNYWVMEEFYKEEQTTSQIIEHVASWRPNKVYPDPAEPDRNAEARKAGLNVRDVIKDVEARIVCFQEVLKQGRFHIHSSCVNAIWEFETYSYPEKKPDHNENEAPIKENDHSMDELGMVIYMQEGKSNGSAHVHYSSSAQPIKVIPSGNTPKMAPTYIPRLR